MVTRTGLGMLQYITALRPRCVSLTQTPQRRLSSSVLRQPKVNAKVAPVFGMSKMDYSTLEVPEVCVCDFCLLPVSCLCQILLGRDFGRGLQNAGLTVVAWDGIAIGIDRGRGDPEAGTVERAELHPPLGWHDYR